MNEDTLEHLSSLMDGELSQETGMFVVRRMGSDRQLGMIWERYHLIRECLRRPGDDRVICQLSVDLDELPEDSPATRRGALAWLKPVSGFAVAASVALVAVMLTLDGATPVPQDEQPAAEPFSSPNTVNAVPVSQAASLNGRAESRQRLNGYLLRHNQAAGAVGQQGFVSFVPIVTTSPTPLAPGDADDSAEAVPKDAAVDAEQAASKQR